MSLIQPTTPEAAMSPPQRPIYRSDSELRMRAAVERWGRAKWPEARVCHELVMHRGTVRADVAFVSADHLAVVEIKSEYDNTSRLINQVAMFRLASPEVWIAAAHRHACDAELIRFILPSIGVSLTSHDRTFGPLPDQFELDEVHPAARHEPHQESMLSLLWVEELYQEAVRAGLIQGKTRPGHAALVKLLMDRLSPEERLAGVCRQLRARQAFWRADPPITDV